MYNEFEENTTNAFLEKLKELLEQMPRNLVKVVDFVRYKNMILSAAELEALLLENSSQGQVKIEICELFNMGSITVNIEDLTVYDTQEFARIVSRADNFEIYPKTDGTLQLNLGFQSVLRTFLPVEGE